jgi:hypothetical protein
MLEKECQICHKKFPVVGRWLETERYNLPDTAVYRQLLSDTPCVALGWVKLDTGKEKPEPSPELRKRWQGIMWNVYRVAFLDVREGEVGQFCPSSSWGKGDPLPELDSMESSLKRLLFEARKKGDIPVDESSRKTERALKEILSPELEEKYGYELARQKSIQAFWWTHKPDLLYTKSDGSTLAVEVKVNEDWKHPINEPLACLLEHNAVLNIRIPPRGDRLDAKVRKVVKKAEDKLESTGRAKFMYIW